MRTPAPKKRSQLRRRRKAMFGRKLAPSLRKVLQSGRIAKGSRVPGLWNVTTVDSAKAGSLATAARSAALPHRFRPNNRFIVASQEEPDRDVAVEEESDAEDVRTSQYDDGGSQDSPGKSRFRKRRRRRKSDSGQAVAVPALEEAEESAEEYEEQCSVEEEEESTDDDTAEEYGHSSGGEGTTVEDMTLVDLSTNQSGSEEDDSCDSVRSDCADVHNRAEVFRTLLASGKGSPALSDEGGIGEDGSEDDQEDSCEDNGPEADRRFWVFKAADGGPVLAVMLPPAVVRFVGRGRLRVLHGALDVEGHVLVGGALGGGRPSGVRVVQSGGPLCGPAHLRPLPLGEVALMVAWESVAPLRRTLARLGLDHAWHQLQPLVTLKGAVVLLLDKAAGGVWPEGAEAQLQGPHRAMGFSLSQHRPLASPHHPWRQHVHTLARDLTLGPEEGNPAPRRVVVCGRQNTGKSSLLRVIANTFLNVCPEVLYLDCDPGQCEFTPPATVSLTKVTKPLLGPPFTHIQTPLKSFFLGHVSPISQPDSYCKAVHSLVEYASEVAPQTPLLVNTMGWVNGLGLSLLVDVIRWVQPTDVVQLVAEGADVDLPLLDEGLLETACGWRTSRDRGNSRHLEDVTYHQLPGATYRARSRARAKREAMVLSYLGQHSTPSGSTQQHLTGGAAPFWLWNTVPLRVPMSLVAIHDCDNSVPKQQLLRAICGTIVALCVVPTDWLLETEKPSYPKFINHSGPYECLGYGLVRGVDTSKHHLYISTPEPADRLAEVNALVRGDLHLPESCLAAQAELLQCGWAPYVARAPRAPSNAGSTDAEEEAEGSDGDDDIPGC